MRDKTYLGRNDKFGDMTSGSQDGVAARVISEEFCITKLFDAKYTVKTFPSYASVQLFRHALKSLWVPKYFPPKSKSAALDMWSTYQTDLERVFNENSWMDDRSKKRAIEKLHAIKFHGGYHDEILDKEKMQAFHDNFLVESLEADSFIENQVHFFSVVSVQIFKRSIHLVFIAPLTISQL